MIERSPAGMATPAVNFIDAVRDGALSARQVIVLLVLGLLVLFDGMDTQILGLIAHDMARDLAFPISSFGIIFAAGLLGAVLGAVVLSPLADRVLGRKAMAVLAMAIASTATLATPLAGNIAQLLAVRFIAGVGLGAAVPSIFTLAAEFAPRRHTRIITSCLIAFAPLGSLLGGAIGRFVVPEFGWAMLLYLGGGLTLALTLLVWAIVPESVHFLLAVRNDPERAGAAARRLLPQLPAGPLAHDVARAATVAKQPIVRLFSDGLWRFTLLIWAGYILNQGILYFALSWTPALFQRSGLTTSAGMDAAAMFGLGGAIGTVSQGWLSTRFNVYRVMYAEMALYLIATIILANNLGHPALAPAMIFLIAAGICAFHAGFILLVVETYPDDIRTTGFGWAMGVGRIGATSAPVLAGVLVGLGWSSGQVFAAAAVPALLGLLVLTTIASQLGGRNARSRSAPVEGVSRAPLPSAGGA